MVQGISRLIRQLPAGSLRSQRPLGLALAMGLITLAERVAAQEKVTFEEHVRPILESTCTNCHNPDKKKGGLDLTSFAATMAGGSSGEVLAAGAPNDSRLFASITRAAEPFMPPQGDPLNADQVALIKKWIEGGLLDTPNGVARKAKKPAFTAQTAGVSAGKPEGPPPMPENLLLEPVVVTKRAQATAALASSPWAPVIAISGQKQVLLYHTDTLELLGVIPFSDGSIQSLMFSRNGQLVVAGTGRGGKSGKVVGWEVKTGRKAFEIGEERDTVMAADLSSDQTTVALGGPSRRVKLFHTTTGEVFKDIKKHTDWVTALQFSPDGVLLATGDRAGNLYVWEGKSGSEFFTLPGHTAAITSVSWRADGNILASASEDGTVRLWEMNEGKEVKKWNAHGGGVQSMSFTHDGRLVSCGRDNHAKVWNQEGAQQSAQNQFSDLTLATCFSHDGQRFMVGDWSGRISVWNTADAKLIGDMSAAPPSIEQRLASVKPELEKSQQAISGAKKTLETTANSLAATRQLMEQAKHTIASFRDKSGTLEQSLVQARASAEALLTRLEAPAPAPAAKASAMDLGTAKARAEELVDLTSAAKAALGPMGASVTAAGKAFQSTVPGALTSRVSLAKAKEAEVGEIEKKKAELEKTMADATAAAESRKKELLHWEAAKLNAQVFARKTELELLTAKLESLAEAIPPAEKVIADATAQLAGAPADQKVALEKKLAQAQSVLAELKREKSETETKVEALRRTIDATTAKLLSVRPR